MRTAKMNLAGWLVTCASLLIPWTPASGQQATPSAGETVIFSVWKVDNGPVLMTPIVMMDGSKYTSPPIWGKNPFTTMKFIDTYFRAGRQYRVLSGGGEVGTLTVQKYVADDCHNLEVQVAGTTGLGGPVRALAVSSDKLGRGATTRRAPTDAEGKAVAPLVGEAFRQRGVTMFDVLKQSGKLMALDIERDGKFELIGSFQVGGIGENYNLFIIFEPVGAGKYKAAWTAYQKVQPESQESTSLVDVVDLDGDGTAEVVVEESSDEDYQYSIYKRQAGTWQKIFTGGGAGMC